VPPAALDHARRGQPHPVDRAEQVDVHLRAAEPVGLVEERACRHEARVVHQHVHRSERGGGRVEERRERLA
jgi:hypothetical protein